MPGHNDRNVDLIFTKSEHDTLAIKGYKIERKIGEGSYAKVFVCRKEVNGKPTYLACKVVDTQKAPVDFVKKFFPRELQILLAIDHNHIIHVEYIFQRKSKYYLFMRYAANGDLLDFILQNNARLSENRARLWTTQTLQALEYLHGRNIVHRDIKCENLLITDKLNIKVCDFGFSREMPKGNVPALSKTFCGSLAYTAPEILKEKPYDPKKSDVWSMGVVLFVMLNKKFPFNEPGNRKMIEKQMARVYSHSPKVEGSISPELKIAFYCLLEPDPIRRWSATDALHSKWITMDERFIVRRVSTISHPRRRSSIETAKLNSLIAQANKNAQLEGSNETVLKPVDDTSSASLVGESIVLSKSASDMKDKILDKAKEMATQRKKQQLAY